MEKNIKYMIEKSGRVLLKTTTEGDRTKYYVSMKRYKLDNGLYTKGFIISTDGVFVNIRKLNIHMEYSWLLARVPLYKFTQKMIKENIK